MTNNITNLNNTNNANNTTSSKVKVRDANFELLRIISMLMIVTLHLLSNEGVLASTYLGKTYILGWGLESLCIVASNVYILISGYFLIKSTFSFKKVFKLWFDVIFYSYLLTLLVYLFAGSSVFEVSLANLSLVLLPVTSGQYWFVTSYILLYLLSPYLNKLFTNLSKKEFQNLLTILTVAFVLLKFFLPLSNTFDKTGGYGIMWFIVLYAFAAYIRLHYTLKLNKYLYLFIYFASCGFIFLHKIIFETLKNSKLIFETIYNLAYNYNSLFPFIASLALFMFFRELKVEGGVISKFICFISKASFGVYLIHEQFLVRKILWTKLIFVNESLNSNLLYLAFYIIINVLLIYTTCSVIDLLRAFVFKKISTHFNK